MSRDPLILVQRPEARHDLPHLWANVLWPLVIGFVGGLLIGSSVVDLLGSM